MVVPTVCGDEHGDGGPAIGFDFVVVLCSRLIEARDNQEIGSFDKRGKQAGGPERIGHVQNRLRVQLTSAGSVQFALPEVSSSPTNGEGWCLDDAAGWCLSLKFQKSQIAFEGASSTPYA